MEGVLWDGCKGVACLHREPHLAGHCRSSASPNKVGDTELSIHERTKESKASWNFAF